MSRQKMNRLSSSRIVPSEHLGQKIEALEQSPLIRMLRSRALVALAGFVACLILIHCWHPNLNPRYQISTQLIIDRYIGRIIRFLDSDERADVILLGSSLIHVPCCLADLQYQQFSIFFNYGFYVQNFLHSTYLEHSLCKALGRPISVVSLSVPSSVVGDDLFLFERLVESKKKPSMIVCCIAPRDFLVCPFETGDTPVKQLMADYVPVPLWLRFASPFFNSFLYLGSAFEQSQQLSAVEFWRRKEILSVEKGVHEICSSIVEQTQYRKGLRSITTIFNLLGMYADPRNAPIKEAQDTPAKQNNALKKKNKTLSTKERIMQGITRPADLSDLKSIQSFYQGAANLAYMRKQLKCLERFLDEARIEGIPVTLVMMPLTESNKKLIANDIRTEYDGTIQNLVSRYRPLVLVPDKDSPWTLANFSDSAHLNLFGAQKLLDRMSAKLSGALLKL